MNETAINTIVDALSPSDWCEIYNAGVSDRIGRIIGPDGQKAVQNAHNLTPGQWAAIREAVEAKAAQLETGFYDDYKGEVRRRGSATYKWLQQMRAIMQTIDEAQHGGAGKCMTCGTQCEARPDLSVICPKCELRKLVTDLWWFIENVTEDDYERNTRFFALRERVRSLQA